MIQTIDLLGFLTLGLLGGFGHCVGMCSPFVLFVSRRYDPPESGRRAAFAAQLWYTAGREATYAVLGAVAGAVGGVVQLAGTLLGLQRAAAIVAGAVLVVWALLALSDLVPRGDAKASVFARLSKWDPAPAGLLAHPNDLQGLRNMEAEAAKYIGAGLATLGMIGAGIGVGAIFSGFLQGALRNPSAASGQFTNLVLGFALTEALGILAFVLGLLILFS